MAKAKALQVRVGLVHYNRFLRWKGGSTPEDIAKEDGIGVDIVKRSIALVQGERALQTTAEMERTQRDIVISNAEKEKKALGEALEATIKIEVGGKVIKEPDHATRLKASSALTAKIEALAPKSKGVHVEVNQAQQQAQQRNDPQATAFAALTVEDRLRQIQQQRAGANLLPPAPDDAGTEEHEPVDSSEVQDGEFESTGS